MSSNAIEQAKAMAKQAAETQTLFVPLALMQALLAEIERLERLVPKPTSIEAITTKHTDIRT